MKNLTIFIAIPLSFIFCVFYALQTVTASAAIETKNESFKLYEPIEEIEEEEVHHQEIVFHHFSDEEVEWMVKNVYFEARNEPESGQIAVIMVTMNRVLDPNYPNTIQQVVTQKNTRGCQFSWYCDGKPDVIKNKKSYKEIKELVLTVLPVYSIINDVTNGAIFYHATYVSPYWKKHVQKTVKIGRHIFYKHKEEG